MKKNIVLFLSVFLSFSLFGQVKNMAEYREKKMSFYWEPNYNVVVSNIENEINLLRMNKADYSDELFLTFENFFIVDKLFFSLVDNKLPKNKINEFKNLFLSQEEKCEKFIGKKDYKEFTSDFILSLGDLKCQMPYVISITKAIPKLKKAKDLYISAVEIDPSSSPALMSKALWFEYSPGIGGGSHKKAYEIILLAEKAATSDVDRYFSLMFKGQILKSLKKDKEASDSVRKAHNLFPDETFYKYMEKHFGIKI